MRKHTVNKLNYLKKVEEKNLLKQQAGLISERFPKVSGIVIYMTYYHKAENPVLMKRTVNFFPTSYAYFKIECIVKGCEGGGFDLKRVVTGQIKNHKKLLKGEIICKGKNGDTVSCHSNISYEINIKYNRSSK